jgi:hypothetical protein
MLIIADKVPKPSVGELTMDEYDSIHRQVQALPPLARSILDDLMVRIKPQYNITRRELL